MARKIETRTFREIYRSKSPLGKQEFETKIALLCMKSPGTVRQWANGHRNPSALCKKIIAENMERKVDELFPEVVNEKAC